jgi:hypothetical protein
MKKERPKYYTVTYCKHIHEKRLYKALSKEEAIEMAMGMSGGMVNEKSVDCFQITKKDYDQHFA